MEPTTAIADSTAPRESVEPARVPAEPELMQPELLVEELLVEEISIDGMCGVY